MANPRLRDQMENLKKGITIISKGRTECEQDWNNHLLIVHFLGLFIVTHKCIVKVGLFNGQLSGQPSSTLKCLSISV